MGRITGKNLIFVSEDIRVGLADSYEKGKIGDNHNLYFYTVSSLKKIKPGDRLDVIISEKNYIPEADDSELILSDLNVTRASFNREGRLYDGTALYYYDLVEMFLDL